jgi:hypothetical protein
VSVYLTAEISTQRGQLLRGTAKTFPLQTHIREVLLSNLGQNNNGSHSVVFAVSSGAAQLAQRLGYGLDDRKSWGGGSLATEARDFFLTAPKTGSGAHPTSYPMATEGSFLGGKAAGT